MTSWAILLDILVLLATALVLGILLERLRQNALIGYLLTGVLLGPSGLRVVAAGRTVEIIAELGVALLLFTIGLEFSWKRLRQLGGIAAGGGSLQILLTAALFSLAGMSLGLGRAEALVIGAAAALSSTAVVLRVLASRAELDSLHGRDALGILLLQDLAVVPLVLIVDAFSGAAQETSAAVRFGTNLLAGALFVVVMILFGRLALSRLFNLAASHRNRDLPVLLAVTSFLLAAWGAHTLHLSPILGAFVAGMVLAETPFADQIRADVTPLRAAFVTIFFASIGMLVELPGPAGLLTAALLAIAIIVGKSAIVSVVVRLYRRRWGVALAAGMALAQIGEFSFVLGRLAFERNLLSPDRFQTLLAASLLTLLVTPYLIAGAAKAATLVSRDPDASSRVGAGVASGPPGRVIVAGFGPAGQAVVSALQSMDLPFLVLELNPQTVQAHRTSFPIHLGDATQPEILEHAGLASARGMVITLPDPEAVRRVIRQAKSIAPHVTVIARARHHITTGYLLEAGADAVVDEEEVIGETLGRKLRPLLD